MPDPNESLRVLLNLSQQPGSSGSRQPGGIDYAPPVVDRGRNNARTAMLARLLGIEDSPSISQTEMESAYGDVQEAEARAAQLKALAAIAPEQVRGQYGVEQERVKGGFGREIEGMKAQTAAHERETSRMATAEQNRLNRESINQRFGLGEAGKTARTGMVQSGTTSRQARGQAERQAQLLQTGKVQPPYPQPSGILERLQSVLGMGKFDPTTAANAEANRLRSNVLSAEATEPENEAVDPQAVARYYLSQYPGVDPNELASIITREQADASPEEIAAVLALIGQQ